MENENKYDNLIIIHSGSFRLPKYLIKGQIKQESRFNPRAVSSADCEGLMQLSKMVQLENDVKDPFNPDENIKYGCKHLKKQYNIFKKEEGIERLKFSVGAYNGGAGYIIAAQKEAVKNNCPDDKWCYISAFLKDIKYKGKKCDWKQIVEYVDKVIYNMFEYTIMDFAKKVDCDEFSLDKILKGGKK